MYLNNPYNLPDEGAGAFPIPKVLTLTNYLMRKHGGPLPQGIKPYILPDEGAGGRLAPGY